MTGETFEPGMTAGSSPAREVVARGRGYPDSIPAIAPVTTASRAAKRLMDLALAVPVVIALSPLLALIALLVRLDSPGPALFIQPRVGGRFRRGRWALETFPFRKFRTMRLNADPDVHRQHVMRFIAGEDQAAVDHKIQNDARITRVGRWLRRFSLDELPQLWNVLTGDMSLVGPRPPIPYEVEVYTPEQMRRLAAKPGITGLWQVSGRSLTTFDGMVELDIEYARRQSLLFDLRILLKTIAVTLSGTGA